MAGAPPGRQGQCCNRIIHCPAEAAGPEVKADGRRKMEAVVFILSLVDCCALIFLSVYFVSFYVTCFQAEINTPNDTPTLRKMIRVFINCTLGVDTLSAVVGVRDMLASNLKQVLAKCL